MGNIFYWDFEAQIILFLQGLRQWAPVRVILDAFFNALAFFGEELIGVLVLGIFYWGFNKKKGVWIGWILLSGQLFMGVIKNIFCRLRPYQSVEGIELIRDVDGYSFPSGHSITAALLYPSAASGEKKKLLNIIAIVLPPLVALSRMYLGAHWLSDVLVGLAIGYLHYWAVALHPSVHKYFRLALIIELVIMGVGFAYCTTSDYYTSYGLAWGMVFGTLFEEKFVHFENTSNLWLVILRTLIGAGLYLVLNSVIKALFGSFFAVGLPERLFRTIRYAFIAFILIGVYPYSFQWAEKLFKRSKD